MTTSNSSSAILAGNYDNFPDATVRPAATPGLAVPATSQDGAA